MGIRGSRVTHMFGKGWGQSSLGRETPKSTRQAGPGSWRTFKQGKVQEKWQPEGESLKEPVAAGGENKQAGLPCRGGAGACTGPVSGLVCTEQHSKAAIVE